MNQIRKLLKDRIDSYTALTGQALAMFKEKLNKAMQYTTKLDRDINWIAIETFSSDSFIFVIGVLSVEEGDVIHITDGKQIIVDDDFIKNHSNQTLIRVMVNVDDLDVATPKELHLKIKEFYDLAGVMSHEQIMQTVVARKITDLKELLDELTSPPSSTPAPISTEMEKTQVEQIEDFDLSALSEDQRKQLKYYSEMSTKVKN